MTDERDDDDAAGVPPRGERGERTEHIESGRHVTNRNVVPRLRDGDSGPHDFGPPADAFDLVTPVHPQPRGAPARDSFDVITPSRPVSVEALAATGEQHAPTKEARGDAARADAGDTPRPDAAVTARPDAARGDTPPRAAMSPAEVARHPATGVFPGMRMPRARAAPVFGVPAPDDTSPDAAVPGDAQPRPRAASAAPDLAGDSQPGRRAKSELAGDSRPGRRARSELAGDSHRGRRGASPRPELADPARNGSEPPDGRAATEPGRSRRSANLQVPGAVDRALRVAFVFFVFGLGAGGLAQPTSVLRGGVAWLVFLFFVLTGWGAIVARLARVDDPDAGQRAALGAAGYLAIAGPLIALGVLTRPIILALICVGFAGFAWREATTKVALWRHVRAGALHVRDNPALGALAAVLVAFACFRLVGAVGTLDRNPWDDDAAYTPLVKRLLDLGNLIEPFSFRRLAAYGGHTALQALAGARGSLANIHLADRGLGLGMVLLGMVGYARERRTQPVWLALLALVVLLLPEAATNTACYWLGAALFVALYRAVVREHWALVGLLGAAACTLRQNFLAPVVVLVAFVLGARLIALLRIMPRREAWLDERPAWRATAGVALAVIVPWWIAAVLSSHTFLYPVIDGTWNHALSITPAVVTWTDELGFLLTCGVETAPFTVLPILAIVIVFVVDHRRGRPLGALAVASAAGIALLAHGLVGSEASNVWRYGFGFVAALLIALVLEVGAEDDARITLAPLGRWILLAALALQLALGRTQVPKELVALASNLAEAAAVDRHGDPSARAEQRRYAAMQAALPAGARVLVMLDDPAWLDYRRNAITNLDVPGFASPGPQLPAFAGAEPLRAYLVAEGYRYVAFVRSARSRYALRREFWVQRMFTDNEFFRIMSAYTVDAIDGFAELATTTPKLYDSDGLVVLDLAHPLRPARTTSYAGDEPTRRTAWTRALADREGLHDAWSLTSRADLRFEDGVGGLRFVDGSVDDPRWYEVSHAPSEPPKRGTGMLTMLRRVHLRVRGQTDMRLALRAAIALNTAYTHPRLDVSLDGELLASVVADASGRYAVDAVVPRARLAGGWHDVYLVFSSISEPEREVRELRVARLEAVEWAPP